MQAEYLYGDQQTIQYTASGADARNSVVTLGTSPGTGFAGVALAPVANGEVGALTISGVFKVDKIIEKLFTIGQTVYWNATADPAGGSAETGAATDNPEDFPLGICVDPLTEDGDKVVVRLQQPMVPSS